MGRKTKLALQYLFAAVFVMLLTTMFFTKDFVMSEPEESDVSEVSTEELEDGTYTGSSKGFGGPIEVEVEVSGGEITEVVILEHSESVDDVDEVADAIEDVPANIVEANSADVDTVSGASLTSNAIMKAVANALSGDESDADTTDEETTEDEEITDEEETSIDLDAIEAEDITYEDGTYTGSAEGFGDDDLEVEVTILDGKIDEVLIIEHSETEQVAELAFVEVPEAILRRNSADVDTVSGATMTSEAIIGAVESALEDAQ